MNTLKRSSTAERPGKNALTFAAAIVFLLAAAFFSVYAGSVKIDFFAALGDVLGGRMTSGARILLYSRLPRTLAPLLAGAAFSASGVLIQGVLGNALAGPNIVGVNSGAGLMCVLCAAFLPLNPGLIPLASFLGAFLAVMLVYFVGLKTGASRLTLVLAGIAVGTTLTAVTNAVTTFFPSVLSNTADFFVGGFSGVTLSALSPAWLLIAAALIAALLSSRALDVLSLGEETAKSLGLRVSAARFFLILLASLLAGAAVSFSGLLGFVGLAVPHMARSVFGTESRKLTIGSALLGAAFLTVCDTLSRVLFAPYELPVGVITSLTGGPFFLALLIRRRRGRMNDKT